MAKHGNAPRVAVVGRYVAGFENVTYLGDESLHEFHAVVFFASGVANEFRRLGVEPGYTIYNNTIEQIASRVEFAQRRFLQWLSEGHVLVVVLDASLLFPYLTTSEARDGFDLLGPDIETSENLEPYKGQRVRACGGLLKEWEENIHYKFRILDADATPLLEVATAKSQDQHLVGAVRRIGNGHVVLTPPPLFAPGEESRVADYYTYLSSVPALLKRASDDLPNWVNEYCTEDESRVHETIDELDAKIAELNYNIEQCREQLAEFRRAKRLFADYDNGFREAVAEALAVLGFNVVEGPEHHADLVAYDGDVLIAIEVKGLEASAKPNDVSQATRWKADVACALDMDDDDLKADAVMAQYREILGNLGIDTTGLNELPDCKSMIVIGTFRKTPLSDRIPKHDFPDQVVRVCKRTNTCALTGLELFGLAAQVKLQPDQRASMRKALSACSGRFSAPQWHSFISFRPSRDE